MEQLGAPTMLVCSNVSPDAIDDDALAAEQLHALAERAAERGLRIAYEALAWGRHVSEYDHAWRIVAAADHPALGTCLDSFHILSRGTDLGRDRRASRARSIFYLQLADAPHLSDGRPAVEPPLPLLPRPGRVRPRRLRRARARRGLRRPALARGLQRRLPPGRPRPHGDRRDALAARARGPSSPAAARALDGFAFVEIGVDADSAPETEALLRAMGFAHVGPAPQQAGAAVGARRHPRRAQPRRRRRRPRGGRGRRRERATRALSATRAEALLAPGARAPPRPRRGRPRGGRRARRHAVFFCGPERLARRLPRARAGEPAATRVPIDRIDHITLAQPFEAFDEAGAVLPLGARPAAGRERRSWRRPTGSSAAARSRARDGRVRIVLNVPGAGRHAARPGRAPARRVRLRRRARRRARDARARRAAAARSRTTTTTTSRRGSSSTRRCSTSCASSACSTTATRGGELLHFYTRRSGAACSSRCSSGAAATTATAPSTHPCGWQRSADRASS